MPGELKRKETSSKQAAKQGTCNNKQVTCNQRTSNENRAIKQLSDVESYNKQRYRYHTARPLFPRDTGDNVRHLIPEMMPPGGP